MYIRLYFNYIKHAKYVVPILYSVFVIHCIDYLKVMLKSQLLIY